MRLFATDLDNTLIYSYKREIGKEKRLVETMDGRELSFMTEASYRLLAEVRERYCFVPVTTRSLRQYGRICFSPEWIPEYALVSNGGNLLRQGEADLSWYEESKALCAAAEASLQEAEKLLAVAPEISFEIRRVDGLFVFTKSRDAASTTALLKERLDGDRVDVLSNGSKVYILPRELSKGAAVRRLQKRIGADRIAAAGDSEFDVSMLLEADEAWFPQDLNCGSLQGHEGRHVIPQEEIFSDRILHDLCI